jgi:RNA polymerase sigma factor (sigma-70 family)
VIEVSGQAPIPDADSFDEFYRHQFDRAARLAYLLTGSELLAPEIAQDALVTVLQRWDVIQDPAAYLRTAVLYRSRSTQRRAILERRHQFRVSVSEGVEAETAIDETWQRIVALSADQRSVVVLRYYEDRPLAEIAEMLGKPLGTVKSLLHRALSHLKETIHD